MKKAILLHHAGGDKYAYKALQNQLSADIKTIAIELPGRGDRFTEPLLHDYKQVVHDYFHQIKDEISDDYFMVGVSMGTMAAYELCRYLHQNQLALPQTLFLSARLSPNSYKNEPLIDNISSHQFWEIVKQYNGVPESLIAHQELRALYEPILRADFEILAKYNQIPHDIIPLPINAHVLIGKEDYKNITIESAKAWSAYFTEDVTFKEFNGGHFVVYENAEIAHYINSIKLHGR